MMEQQEYWKVKFRAGKGLRVLQESMEQELLFGPSRELLPE